MCMEKGDLFNRERRRGSPSVPGCRGRSQEQSAGTLRPSLGREQSSGLWCLQSGQCDPQSPV